MHTSTISYTSRATRYLRLSIRIQCHRHKRDKRLDEWKNRHSSAARSTIVFETATILIVNSTLTVVLVTSTVRQEQVRDQ